MILPRDGLERENPFTLMREGFDSAPAAQAALERRLSDYTDLEPIGSGLRGTVYRARGPQGRLVALKLYNRGVRIDLEALRRFSADAESPIQHPSLVPVEAAGEENGQAFCAMALLRGDSLDQVLIELRGEGRRKPHLSPLGTGPDGKLRGGFIRQAVANFLDVAEGLDRAHRAGLVHGRLSPRNLIFTPAGRLVMTDFGSEWTNGSRRVGSGVSHDLATLAYRAPEQIDPLPDAPDGRVDVYALGAILYQVLTRRPPFDGRNPQEIRDAISEGRFLPPTTIEPLIGQEAEAVILQAMALHREDRYPGAGSFARDLRRLLRLEATEAWGEILSSSPPRACPPPPADARLPLPLAALSIPEVPAPAILDLPPEAAEILPTEPEVLAGPQTVEEPRGVGEPLGPANPEAREAPVTREAPGTREEPETGEDPVACEAPAARERSIAHEDPMAAGDPVAAPVDPEPPSPAPIVLERPARPRARRLRGLGVAVAAVLVLGSIASWTWLTLFLHDAGEKSRVRAEIFSLGLGHLQRAVLALFVEDREAAGTEVVETRRLGISDPLLERIEAELRKRPADPVLDDLGHPRAPVRRQALVTLREEVESGARPAGDLIAAAAALGDDDLPVREAAILALSRGGSSAPLLKAFPLGTGLPPLALDAPTFLALVDALSVIADGPAQAALLAWSFQDFERLDAGSEEAEQSLAPNLRILPAHGEPARFARAWILSRGRIGSADVLAFARRAVEGEARLLPLVDAIAGGLANLRGGEAARALAALAAEFHVDHGPRIVEALSALGAAEDLLDLSRAPLPDGLRARAVRAAGRAALASGKGLREIEDGLRELAQADPSAEVRRQAFRTAVELGPGQGAAAAAQALPDPALRDEALEFLAQRPLPASLPILLEHLRRGDADLRQKAARALGATRDPAALGPLALLLYEEPAEVRAGALEALREIGLVRALPLVAGILPPRDPALVEMALEATRCPLERGESPALRLLALREPLGLTGPSDPPQALREARRALLRSALPGAGAGSTAGWPARAEAVLTGVPGR